MPLAALDPRSIRPPADLEELHRRLVAAQNAQDRARTYLRGQAIGTGETAIAHGLGSVPQHVNVTQLGNATVWKTKDPDATNVYLAASVAVSADLEVVR